MEMPVGSISAEVPRKDQSLGFRGLYEVFVQPTSFFARLKQDPKILVPYLVGFLFMVVVVIFTSDMIARMQIEELQRQAADNPNIPQNVNPQIIKTTIMVLGPIFWLLSPLIIAGLAYFWGNFVMAGRATYRQLLSVALYGEIIYLVGGLILLPLMLAKDSVLVTLSLAALVTPDPQSFVWVALSKISVFLIWEVVAVGIGLTAIYGFSRNKGYLLSVLSVGLISALHVCFTAIRTLF
jgi:hypothetical protein